MCLSFSVDLFYFFYTQKESCQYPEQIVEILASMCLCTQLNLSNSFITSQYIQLNRNLNEMSVIESYLRDLESRFFFSV